VARVHNGPVEGLCRHALLLPSQDCVVGHPARLGVVPPDRRARGGIMETPPSRPGRPGRSAPPEAPADARGGMGLPQDSHTPWRARSEAAEAEAACSGGSLGGGRSRAASSSSVKATVRSSAARASRSRRRNSSVSGLVKTLSGPLVMAPPERWLSSGRCMPSSMLHHRLLRHTPVEGRGRCRWLLRRPKQQCQCQAGVPC
jgi:hypothetical protein